MLDLFLRKLETHSKVDYQTLHSEFRLRVSEDEYKSTYSKLIALISNQEIQSELLKHGKFRFKKEKYGLPRTIQILTNTDKQLFAILESKNKLSGGGKIANIQERNLRNQSSEKRLYYAFDLTPNEGMVGDRINIFASLAFYRGFDENNIKEAEVSHTCKAGLSIYYSRYKTSDKEKLSFYSKLGVTLRDYLKLENYVHLTTKQKQNIFYGILDELYILHSNNIIHQDLKPHNIIVYFNNNKLQVKITDFGLCSKLKNASAATAGYESPEMCAAGALVRLYPEQYSSFITLCMLLFNLPACKLPYEECAPNERNDMWALGVIYLKLMYIPLLDVSNINKDKKELKYFIKGLITHDDILGKLLTKNRDDRYSTEKLYQYVANERDKNKPYNLFLLDIGSALLKDLQKLEEQSMVIPEIVKSNIKLLSLKLLTLKQTKISNLAHFSNIIHFTFNIIKIYKSICFFGKDVFLESTQSMIALLDVFALQGRLNCFEQNKIIRAAQDFSEVSSTLNIIFTDDELNKIKDFGLIQEQFNQLVSNDSIRFYKKR